MSLPFSDATGLAAAIREKRASAREVVAAHLDRIDALDGALHAVVRRNDEAARAQARAADEALARGDRLGPLHGVPFTLKDQHDVRGMPSSLGARATERTPDRDGAVVERLRAAGAIFLGKTNLAMNVQGWSELHGRVHNPWDLGRTAGGSSGGAAAAVAARLTPFDVGTDATGSIRMPAHFCGALGIRPTARWIPSADLALGLPGQPRVDRDLATAGPIARTPRDLDLLMRVLAGPHPRDADVPAVPWVAAPPVEPRSLRISFVPAPRGIPIARALRSVLGDAVERLTRAGARVEEHELPVSSEEVLSTFRALFRPMLAALAGSGAGPPGSGGPVDAPSALDHFAALDRRDRIVLALEEWLGGYDAVLCPAAITSAFPIGALGSPVDVDGEPVSSTVVDHPCLLATVTGSPALVVPVGRDARGLPVGAQLIGRRWCDARLIAVADAVVAAVGALPAPPLALGLAA